MELTAELHELLDDLVWNTADGMIREHQLLAVMIDPLPGEAAGTFDVPFTVLPLESSSSVLEGVGITLTPVDGVIQFVGRLDVRGQVVFKNLPGGRYTVSITA